MYEGKPYPWRGGKGSVPIYEVDWSRDLGAYGQDHKAFFRDHYRKGEIRMFKLALCQIKGSFDKKEGMATATRYVETAAENGAQVISSARRCGICPYSNDYFREYAEAEDGPTVKFLSDLAAKHDIYLIGGSIPELDGGKVYNTSFSFDRSGQIIGKHRKVHLFDIDVKGGNPVHGMLDTLTGRKGYDDPGYRIWKDRCGDLL